MSPGPAFRFAHAFAQWYDSDSGTWRSTVYDFTRGEWYEDGVVRDLIYAPTASPNNKIYVGANIENRGDAPGIPVFRVLDVLNDDIEYNEQRGSSLITYAIWSPHDYFVYDGEITNLQFNVYSLEGGALYPHDQVGPPYVRVML